MASHYSSLEQVIQLKCFGQILRSEMMRDYQSQRLPKIGLSPPTLTGNSKVREGIARRRDSYR
jgi:hypothetical protein